MATPQDRRPDPEELLRRLGGGAERNAHRGRLKLFLGYASRVGKSFRLLDEGRRRKERGQDVVVGMIQPKQPPDVQKLLEKLEIVPSDGALDVHAILARRPQVCLVDELAYHNPPGSRHAERWEDVEELLEAGITVVTAINLQHIAEQQDAVERITGKRRTETVPEKFVRTADEIVVIDAPPHDAAADTRALLELRELALLLAAEVVESGDIFLGSQEKILVCITPRSNVKRMLDTARKIADRFHCEILVLNVRQERLAGKDEELLERYLSYAGNVGGKTHVMEADDFATTVLEFARAQRVTQIFVGHSMRSGWKDLFFDSPLDRLIQAAESMDVRIFPHDDPA
jgi:two-component system, OmpR family, sensor histidine kinase KdpD